MGRNAAIKHFDAYPPGTTPDLFGDKAGRMPALIRILSTPWVTRASSIATGTSTGAAVRAVERPVAVVWDGEVGRPLAFWDAGKRHQVDSVSLAWSIERHWWDRDRRVSRRIFRVHGPHGVLDLAYDRLGKQWLLVGISD